MRNLDLPGYLRRLRDKADNIVCINSDAWVARHFAQPLGRGLNVAEKIAPVGEAVRVHILDHVPERVQGGERLADLLEEQDAGLVHRCPGERPLALDFEADGIFA